MDWYPWYPALYRKATMHLTIAQDGAYRRLIDEYMTNGFPLPSNGSAIARIIGISLEEWEKIAPAILPFFQQKGELLHNERCDIELERQARLSNKRSEVAKKAAQKRNSNQIDMGNCQAFAEQNSATRQDKTRQESISKDIDLGERMNGHSANGQLAMLPEPPKRKGRRRKPDTPWPDGFVLTPELATYSRSKLPTVRPQTIFEEFQNWHTAKGSLFADWPAAFRTWVGKAANRANGVRR